MEMTEIRMVKVTTLSPDRCSLNCVFLRIAENRLFLCSLYNAPLAHDWNVVFRTGDCRDREVK